MEEEEVEYQEFKFTVPMQSVTVEVELDCEDCEEKHLEATTHAVALIGDAFYHGAFLPATELEKASSMWENTLHDINHQGTTDARGLSVSANILYFVGYNKDVIYNPETKAVSMDINIVDNTYYASAWRGYVELCKEASQIPNVSVSFLAQVKQVRVSDLPEGVNYEAYGYDTDDMVAYIYDIHPQALSTVFQGACSDKQGCGIGKCNSKELKENKEKREEILSRIKQKEKYL